MTKGIRLLNVDPEGRDTCPCFVCGANPSKRDRFSTATPHHRAGVFEARTEPEANRVREMFKTVTGHEVTVRSVGYVGEYNERGIGVTTCERHKDNLSALRAAIKANAMLITRDLIAQAVSQKAK